MELKELREQIDCINDQLTELFIKRMELSALVAEQKTALDLPLVNATRERDIITKQTAKMPNGIKSFGKQFYECLFNLSKSHQSRIIDSKSPILQKIKTALADQTDFCESATVACQGVLGAYSQIATDKMVDVADILYFKDFDGVFSAVEKGLCNYGVLPVENSTVGSVNSVYDAMQKHNFSIVRAIKLRISHYLLAKQGVKIENVTEVFSHEKAIGQCSKLLKQLGVKITVCENTAVAAKMVAESHRTDVACISSKECASIYNLNVLRANVQDSDNNYTRFILISKKLEIYADATKISVMVSLPHEAGSLSNVLSRFATLGLNLTKLESRPIPERAFEFCFYFDFEGNLAQKSVQSLIAELDNHCPQFVFLGNYMEKIG